MHPSVAAKPLSILVVDDHALVREAFVLMLRREFPDAVVVPTASCSEALAAVRQDTYDIVLVDIELGDRSGMELTMELSTLPTVPIIIAVSTHQEEIFIKRTLRLGAKAYVAKDAPPAELFAAIRAALDGRSYISKELAQQFAHQMFRKRSVENPHERLSNRELEVLIQLAQGKSAKQTANDLALSPKTVGVHKFNLCQKMGLRTTVDILKYCQTHHLV